jgi:organic radical activating enzyme
MAALLPWIPAAEGLTISGGEPFDQPDALDVQLKAV